MHDHTSSFRSLEPRRRWAEWLLWLVMSLSGLSIPWSIFGILAMGDIIPVFWSGGWTTYDDLSLMLEGASVVAILLSAMTFIRWHRQAVRNLPALGVEHVERGATWASLSWFVPFANLFVPYASLREVAQATEALDDGAGPQLWSLQRTWWSLWIAANLVSGLAERIFLFAEQPKLWVVARGVLVLADGLILLAGFFAIAFIGHVTRRQEALYSRRLEPLGRPT